MNHDLKHEKVPGHGDYERRDIGVAGVLYFLLVSLVAEVSPTSSCRAFIAISTITTRPAAAGQSARKKPCTTPAAFRRNTTAIIKNT